MSYDLSGCRRLACAILQRAWQDAQDENPIFACEALAFLTGEWAGTLAEGLGIDAQALTDVALERQAQVGYGLGSQGE